METLIETSRCTMRKIIPADANDLFELDSDPRVSKYTGQSVQALEESIKVIEIINRQYSENGIGRYAVIEKATGEFMGWSGLKLEKEVRAFQYYDLGYRFKPRHWGKGIATETAIASLEYGFVTMGYQEICAAADVENIASNVVIKKVGLNFIEEFSYHDTRCNWYALSKAGWEENVKQV